MERQALEEARKSIVQFLTHSARTNDDAFQLLRRLSEAGRLASMIFAVLADSEALELLLKGSYSHPNGFTKLVLLRDDSVGFQLRLHFWERSSATTQLEMLEPHNHIRDFWSVPLFGELTARDYREAEDGLYYRKFRASDRALSDRYEYEDLGDVRLRVINEVTVSQSSTRIHSNQYSTVHSIVANAPTATLFLQAEKRQSNTLVYKPTQSKTYVTHTPPLSGDDLSLVAAKIFGYLSPANHSE